MLCKILRLFVNTLTADDKYSLLNRGIFPEHIQMQLSEKQKASPLFFGAFLKSILNFENFHKNITLIAYLFAKLQNQKNSVR